MKEILIQGTVSTLTSEDSGAALIAELDDTKNFGTIDDGFFVRLHSWCEAIPPVHPTMEALSGKRVRIRIEILE